MNTDTNSETWVNHNTLVIKTNNNKIIIHKSSVRVSAEESTIFNWTHSEDIN